MYDSDCCRQGQAWSRETLVECLFSDEVEGTALHGGGLQQSVFVVVVAAVVVTAVGADDVAVGARGDLGEELSLVVESCCFHDS